MRFATVVVTLLWAVQVSAWTGPLVASRKSQTAAAALSAISTPADSSSSNSEMMGRILEGGKVIDFSSVKASCKAEKALAEARQSILVNGGATTVKSGGDAILGINQDVVKEVGHELGTFADAASIQACAAYLRSKAPAGLLLEQQRKGDDHNDSFAAADVEKYKQLLAKAYFEAGEVTSAFAKTFYMGTMLLPEDARKAIWAVYVWCRRTDEIVDAPRGENDDDMMLDLSAWEMRLENLWRTGEVVDVYDLCLLDVRINYPSMDIQPFMDMIRGMLMDIPGLGVERYTTFDELHLYCYRVAGTVGVMSLPVFGCAPGFDDDTARYVRRCSG
jgi:15-cis-phytoene synthase